MGLFGKKKKAWDEGRIQENKAKMRALFEQVVEDAAAGCCRLSACLRIFLQRENKQLHTRQKNNVYVHEPDRRFPGS